MDRIWARSIVQELIDYVKIPNESPAFDADWADAGHMDRAVNLVEEWCRGRPIEGLQCEVVRLPGRTPLIYMEVPGSIDDTVLLYGHLDKQPAMTGWEPELGPWTPVLRDGRLYGRGAADDGYAAFASLTALEAVCAQGSAHARCVVLIEACEESGSGDLPAYMDALAERIGEPSLVVCLDSGCGNYDQFWCTTSLRGMVVANLGIDVLREGVHSGDASGIVPDSFRIARQLLSRLEDDRTGELLLPSLHVPIPEERIAQARIVAQQLGGGVTSRFPFAEGVEPVVESEAAVLARTWRPTMTVTGQQGLPDTASAGNVLRPTTDLKLSFRLPPTCDSGQASAEIKRILCEDAPHAARVRVDIEDHCNGWDSPPVAAWLARALDDASMSFFDRPACFMGEGGTIPFMGMLGEQFPEAQFVITGVLGPGSNAHGPNEFLHLGMARRLTACVAHLIADHGRR